jgi:hypothetical protein
LSPLVGLEKLEATPFINIEKEVVTHHIIHLTTSNEKSICNSNNQRYIQYTLAYAFDKSRLIIVVGM